MENFKVEINDDGVAIVRFDTVGRSVNTLTVASRHEVGKFAAVIRDDPRIVGAVILSARDNGFCAGADLVEMERDIAIWRRAETQAELIAALADVSLFSRHLRALETTGKPIAAVVNGLALGGGLELALACHYRIGIDDPQKLRLGFPEATIGLLPGAGGTQRLPRLMGNDRAVAYLLGEQNLDAQTAVETGVLHALAPEEELLPRAIAWVLANPGSSAPWDVKGFKLPGGTAHSPTGYATFPYAVARATGRQHLDHPGQANILRAVYEGTIVPMDAALRIEARYFLNTVRTPEAAAMVRTMYHSRQTVARDKEQSAPATYIGRLKANWAAEAARLIAEGNDPAITIGVARRLSPRLADALENGGQPPIDLPNPTVVTLIESRLLAAAAATAKACIVDGTLKSVHEANLFAVNAGFPVGTGGPLSLD
ncbi:MAG: enoyl-CoA hydratase-related protein [Sphingomonadaceae bacterium]